ncbi:TrbC/VirB2 family protein [Myxococcota bacterium]
MRVIRRLSQFGVGFLTLVWASTAWAQVGDMSRFSTLAQTAITWLQGLALVGCVLGFIRVGYMYNQGDDRAPTSLKNTAIGTAIVAGAAVIMQFIKGGILGT